MRNRLSLPPSKPHAPCVTEILDHSSSTKQPWNQLLNTHTHCSPKAQKVISFNCGIAIRQLENTQIRFHLMIATGFTYPPAITPKDPPLQPFLNNFSPHSCSQSQFNSSHELFSLQWYLLAPYLKSMSTRISVNSSLTCSRNIRNRLLSDLSTSHPNHYKIFSQ